LTFLLTPYLYTFSLCENPSFIIFSAETEYISTRSMWRKSVFDIYFTEFGAALKTVLPVLFKYCYKYCYSDSRKLWAVMKGGGSIFFHLFLLNLTYSCPYSYNFMLTTYMCQPYINSYYPQNIYRVNTSLYPNKVSALSSQTVISLSQHNKNPTQYAGLVQIGHHVYGTIHAKLVSEWMIIV
jgi:hypothetical protein